MSAQRASTVCIKDWCSALVLNIHVLCNFLLCSNHSNLSNNGAQELYWEISVAHGRCSRAVFMCQARENACDHVAIGFGFADWLRRWHEFFKPITVVVKQNQSNSLDYCGLSVASPATEGPWYDREPISQRFPVIFRKNTEESRRFYKGCLYVTDQFPNVSKDYWIPVKIPKENPKKFLTTASPIHFKIRLSFIWYSIRLHSGMSSDHVYTEKSCTRSSQSESSS